METLIQDTYLLSTIVTAFVGVLIFIVIPILYGKYPNIFVNVLKVTGNKDMIRSAYYLLTDIALPKVSREIKDQIFANILSVVSIVENMAAAGEIPKEERKDRAIAAVKEVLELFDIEYTTQIAAMSSNIIELAVTYLGLRKTAQ